MAETSVSSVGPSGARVVHRGEAGTGPFMITLCRLVEPVSIRPPQSPRLRPFTFFINRVRQRDGSEPLYLHMGFFDTLASADKWARAVRGRHPEAKASIAPFALWQLAGWDEPESEGCAADPPADPATNSQPDAAGGPRFEPVANRSLTDTQVLNMLEARRSGRADVDEPGSAEIALVRPDDTGTRRALKEAVIQGLPVSFAVQLQWAVRAIDPSRVPALPVFRGHTLYRVDSRRANRSCFFLRLGFFGDPVSAKQVAAHVRSSFASAAVVPVLDEEVMRAREACKESSSIPCLVQQRRDEALGFGTPLWATVSKPEAGESRRASKGSETLEQTLAQLAERELWNDPDVLSDTGVRHLKVEIEY